MLDLIRKTNGDALGILLFIVLVVYLIIRLMHPSWQCKPCEIALLASCVVALTVDILVVRMYLLSRAP